MADLFLEFTSRQIRRYYGIFSLAESLHLRVLSRWINVAAWLCDDFCLIPVGFPLECRILRRALLRKAALLDHGLVELPLRGTFEAFVRRRRDTYAPYSEDFRDLYTDEIPRFVERFAVAFRDRRSQSADSIVDRWSAGPDTSSLWLPVKRLGAAATNRIARIPQSIHRYEAGIVWDGVLRRLKAGDHRVDDDLQRILQSDFVESYCEEYGTDTLAGLPYHWKNLRRQAAPGAATDYRDFRSSLEPLGLRDLIEWMSAENLVAIRQRVGYIAFIAAFRKLTVEDGASLKQAAATAAAACQGRGSRLAGAVLGRTAGPDDAVLTGQEIEMLDEVLAGAAERMHCDASIAAHGAPRTAHHGGPKHPESEMTAAKPRIAIFVALSEERIVLERSNLLFSPELHENHLVTEKDGVSVEVFCAYGMGRVAAAVATMAYLQETKPLPDLLLVAGLAGGFQSAGMTEGALIVPEQIFDLALRKVKEEKTEFRPETYRADPRLKKYLESNRFDEEKWATAAHRYAEWPKALKPDIRHEPLMSVDEVVSSVSHGDLLRATSQKLAGVEMEAGGVFAAALKFNVPVAVVRGVSDNADPSKADNAWRGRAMKTIISLIQAIDLSELLKQKP